MKQPLDHLKSTKKPARKTVWVAGDSELADELSELEADLSRAESSLRLMEEDNPRREAALRSVEGLTESVKAKREELRGTSIKFVFQAIPRKSLEQLIKDHQPTEQQVADFKESGQEGNIEFNPETYPAALIAACTVEPEVEDRAELEAWLRDGDEWNNVEVFTLFMACNEVNTSRRIPNLGKD